MHVETMIEAFPLQKGQGFSKAALDTLSKLERVCRSYWNKLPNHPFVRAVVEGEISKDQFRTYFTQWGKVIGELILTIYPQTVARFQSVLLKYPDLQRLVVEHMSEELRHQDIDGIYMKTARAFKISYDDVVACKVIPEMQAYLNWVVKLSYQGTFVEIRSSSYANEGCLSRLSSIFAPALMSGYGLGKDDVAYYVEHGPADRKHVQVNARIIGRLIDLGFADERPGYGMLYCAETICKTNFLLLDGVLEYLESGTVEKK